MQVIKRDGRKEAVQFDKITSRISRLCDGLDVAYIDPVIIAKRVIEGLYDGVTTTELDHLAAETAASMTTRHPDFALLAARLAVSNLHKNTTHLFSEAVRHFYHYKDPKTQQPAPLVSEELFRLSQKYAEQLNQAIDYKRDFDYDYFGFKTLERSYLLRLDGKPAERPQQLLMRVALGIHGTDIKRAIETYELLSQRWFTHATPTLFNAGTPNPQMSSCFLLQMKEDSIEGIFDTLKACAQISQSAGGIGVAIHKVRATGSYIRGTGGISNGILPMLRVFNDTARYVDQGGGKRKGSFAMYLEPWHADLMDFLDIRKNHGKEEQRARDLFTALWIPDLFMQRVEENGVWSLFCPNEAPGLESCWGERFEKLYTQYEQEGRARKQLRAQEIWFRILESQIETGTPYLLFKDACNSKSNQQHLGTISSSNLCTEIVEYTAPDETAVCNLASIALPRFVTEDGFDFKKLSAVTKVITRNLDLIIDRNKYPVIEAERSNFRHRPIGIGVQGLADTYQLMRYPFDSQKAKELNRQIFETLYFAAMTASMELAKEKGVHPSYEGSPISQGIFQYDLWGVEPSDLWNWSELKKQVAQHGVRNSLLIALMPTASTSQILGNSESIEPYTTNLFTRRVLSGEFIVVNRQLLMDLMKLDLWNERMKQKLLAYNGSIQSIPEIPGKIKELYKTAWEIKQKELIDQAADRAPYICQSQSMSLFIEQPTFAKLSSMHFYSWKRGLKTGLYYLRIKAAAEAIKFTVDYSQANSPSESELVCRLEEGCVSCGS